MTRFLSVADVMGIHDDESGAPVIDRAKLESAVAQPSLGLLGGFAYEPLLLQAAVLLHRLVMAHAFADGNKRTAWLACVDFLELNGVLVRDDVMQSEVVEFVVAIAANGLDQETVARWLEHITRP